MADSTYVRFLSELTNDDVPLVGGKNASLGEMFSELSEQGVNIPDGFATTSDAYREYLEANDLPERIRGLVDGLHSGERELADVGHRVRELIRHGQFPEAIATAITDAYDELSRRYDAERTDVAVRSSATAEDLPEASFAGQQETFLNVTGHQPTCWRPAATATPRCSPTARSATARSRASTTWTWRSRWACRRWCGPTRRARA
jgi:pyruvate,water dikinase